MSRDLHTMESWHQNLTAERLNELIDELNTLTLDPFNERFSTNADWIGGSQYLVYNSLVDHVQDQLNYEIFSGKISNFSDWQQQRLWGRVQGLLERVMEGSGTPLFITQPQSQVVGTNGTVTFTVQLEDADGYQWYKNGVAVGEASQPYTDSSVMGSDNGSIIWCKAWNKGGTSYSDLAILTVTGSQYRLTGTSYHNLDTPIIITQGYDFEYVFNVYCFSNVRRTLSGTVSSGTSGLVEWDANGAILTRISGVEYTSTVLFPQTVGWHTIRFKRESGAYYFKVDDNAYTRLGSFTHNDKFYMNYIGRGYRASGWGYFDGYISSAAVYYGGAEGVGTKILDVTPTNATTGDIQAARIGSNVTIKNYLASNWTSFDRVAPVAVDLSDTISGTAGDVVSVSGSATGAATFKWFKNGNMIYNGNPLPLDISESDDGAELYFIANGGGGYVMSNKSMISSSAFNLQARALYQFDTLSGEPAAVSSFSDSSGNGYNITSMTANFNQLTLNGNNALSVNSSGAINIPNAVFTGLSDDISVFVVASLNDMRNSNSIFSATTASGELSIIADALNETLTYKLGLIEIVVDKVMDRDVHVYGFTVSNGTFTGYFDTETVENLTAPVSVAISNASVCNGTDSLVGEIIVMDSALSDNVKRNLGVL